MRILIADDDAVSLVALKSVLRKRGHDVVAVTDGDAAWLAQEPEPPGLVILDWMMLGRDGVEVCRLARAEPRLRSLYLILLTSRGGKEHVIAGLQAGANDYITKPFDREELEARVNVGLQVLRLQDELTARVRDLETALANVKQLQGLLPVCAYCKSIRDDQNYWHEVDRYLTVHSEAKLSHGICPRCWETTVKAEFIACGIEPPTLPMMAGK